MNSLTKRLFFSLNPTPASKQAIDAWRQQFISKCGKPVARENFHLTLLFMGQVSTDKQQQLEIVANNISAHKIALTLDYLNCWPKPQVMFLGCQHPPTALSTLQQRLQKACQELGYINQHHGYTPHLTLARKAVAAPQLSADGQKALKFTLSFNEFCLMESLSTDHGVRYDVLNSWQLT